MGSVMGFDGVRDVPLVGANVSWVGTSQGTTADLDGKFHLDFPSILPATLNRISFVGYESFSKVFEKAEMQMLKVTA